MKTIPCILVLILVISCNRPKDRIQIVDNLNLSQKQIDSVLKEYSFEYSNLEFLDSTSYALLPITTERPRGSSSRLSKGSYEADSYPQYWNFIFHNITTNETKLLTKKKKRISYFIANIKNAGTLLSKSILYKISDTDYNNDNRLTYDDPEQLFISGTNGTNLRRLSPINEHLQEFNIVPNSDKIIIKTLRDVNQDFEFDRKDEIVWYKIDLSKDNELTEILNTKQRKEIENLYFQQWLVKNNQAQY